MTVFIAIVVSICLLCLIAGQIWLIDKSERDLRSQTSRMLILAETVADSYIKQTEKIAQMILLDRSTTKFIYQGLIPEGSSDIQTAIDAMSILPTAVNVNNFIANIYVYSKSSDYLLSFPNLYFQIDEMYELFAFQGLSSRQFRSQYLQTQKAGFFPEVEAIIGGQKKSVIPYIRPFPLNNPVANTGKVLILLDKKFITEQLGSLPIGKNGWFAVTDPAGRLITSSDNISEIPYIGAILEGTQERKINGEIFFISKISSTDTGLIYISAVSKREFRNSSEPLWLILMTGMISILGAAIALGFVQFFKNQKHWKKLASLLSSHVNPSYETIADTITTIVNQERIDESNSGEVTFKTASLFRKYIDESIVFEEELRLLLSDIGALASLEAQHTFRLLRLVIHESDTQMNIDDIDFVRIAASKESDKVFQDQAFFLVDHLFTGWILVWNHSPSLLDRNIKLFWEHILKITPFEVSLAVSDPMKSLALLLTAPAQCIAATRSIANEEAVERLRTFDEIQTRKDSFLFSTETEKNLSIATTNGDSKAVQTILDEIWKQNFKERNLNPETSQALIRSLHRTAVTYCNKHGISQFPKPFDLFSECREFFMETASEGLHSKDEIEEGTKNAIIELIEKQYANPSLNLSMAAEMLHMKENYLYHFMSTRIGRTFSQYLEDFRLDQSHDLIMTSNDQSINEIAQKCGYCNPQTFRRAFKKRFGQLPSDFRNLIQSRQTTAF